jgi:hypothetical protein
MINYLSFSGMKWVEKKEMEKESTVTFAIQTLCKISMLMYMKTTYHIALSHRRTPASSTNVLLYTNQFALSQARNVHIYFVYQFITFCMHDSIFKLKYY